MDTKPPSIQTNDIGVAPPDDASLLLAVFPEEVWRLALGNVDNASAYFKICGASPAFHEWFSDHRVHVLFEPVMKILLEEKYHFLAYPEAAAPNDDVALSNNDAAETSGSKEEGDEEGGAVESESEEEDGDRESDEEDESDSEEEPEPEKSV